MAQRLWRQRRRIALAAIIGVWTFALGANLGWVGPILGSLVFGSATALVVTHAPAHRWFVLKAAILALCFVTLLGLTPINPTLAGLIVVAGLILIPSQLVFLDHWRRPGLARARAVVSVQQSVDTLWQAVRPVPGAVFWDPTVIKVTQGERPEVLILSRQTPDGGVLDVPLEVLEIAPLRRFKIRDLSQPTADQGGPVTVTAFTVDGDETNCTLEIVEATWRRPIWSAISLWLDDYLGDHADHMVAVIEGRPDPSLRATMMDPR